jgi:hypothetical protein
MQPPLTGTVDDDNADDERWDENEASDRALSDRSETRDEFCLDEREEDLSGPCKGKPATTAAILNVTCGCPRVLDRCIKSRIVSSGLRSNTAFEHCRPFDALPTQSARISAWRHSSAL